MGYFKELSINNSGFTEDDCIWTAEECTFYQCFYQCGLYPCLKHYDDWHRADVEERNKHEDFRDRIRSEYYNYVKKKLIEERNLVRSVLK